MKTLLKNGMVYTPCGFEQKNLLVEDGKVFLSFDLEADSAVNKLEASVDKIVACDNKYIVPGFVDVHVHLREPGFFYKETIKTGTMAGARGGYTTICSMPNVNPAPATLEALQVQLDIIERDAVIKVIPYGTITSRGDGRSRLADMEELSPYVLAFSDDGKGVQSKELMEAAMIEAKRLGKVIVAHCEDESLLHNGYIHDGEYARSHGHRGISSDSEWVQVMRDVQLAEALGCRYHVCHVSTAESVKIIRAAKGRGVGVTCETAPHYLVLSDADLREEGRFKMNPPLRGAADRAALIAGIQDGTIDMLATDHAPHGEEEKSRGLEKSPFGIVGLECAFPVLYTNLVKRHIITLDKLLDLLIGAPIRRFNLAGPRNSRIEEGMTADLTILDLDTEFTIDSKTFLSKGKSTPFDGARVQGHSVLTMVDGKIVYIEGADYANN